MQNKFRFPGIVGVLVLIGMSFWQLLFPASALASMRLTSLEKASVKGGETLTIHGTDLELKGKQSCTFYPPGSKQIVWSTCGYTTRVVAMKQEPFSGCPRPINFLPIVSMSGNQAVVRIPLAMQNGGGEWFISVGGVEDSGDEFMIGGELPLTITGVQDAGYTCKQKGGAIKALPKPSPTVTPTIASTATPAPTSVPAAETPVENNGQKPSALSRWWAGVRSWWSKVSGN